MGEKSSNFFEEHIEKMVLAIVVVVCVGLFVKYILFSPNYVEYDGKKFQPGGIDAYIVKQAELLQDKLNRRPEPKQEYESRINDFLAKLNLPLGQIDKDLYLPQPLVSSQKIIDDRVYSIPVIGKIDDVKVGYIRAVAYVPLKAAYGEEFVYDSINSEPNDIDLVTVEATFDVAGLYDRFYENFAGPVIKREWQDPCLAKPIFASIQLQRQELLDNGRWGQWQNISRAKVDGSKEKFKVVENVEDLPDGGMEVRLLQFNDSQVTADLLQPESYKIASAKEEWFPPSLHEKFVDNQKYLTSQEKREEQEGKKEEREKEKKERSSPDRSKSKNRTRTNNTGGGELGGLSGLGGGLGGIDSIVGAGGQESRKTRQPRKRQVEKKDRVERDASKEISEVYDELDELLITDKTDLSKMDEPLLFWAHDDSVEPGGQYRYRVRLGVLNPIAGKDQFDNQSIAFKNKVILWSNFSDVTDTVDIPKKMYFFPRDIQEAAKIVTVQVSRYTLGYWHSKDFAVKLGEIIGSFAEPELTEDEEKNKVTVPKKIDYTTGVVFVDVENVTDWTGGKNLLPRYYFNILYSTDGTIIEHMPIKSRYWAGDLQVKYGEIKKLEKETKLPLRDWGSKVDRSADTGTGGGGTDEGIDFLRQLTMPGM